MSAYYTVIQYVPDPVADERINVGVVAFAGQEVRARFIHDWRRVRQFGREDIGFLKDLAKRAEGWEDIAMPLPGLGDTVRLDEGGVRAIAGRWLNTVQFTEPRASLLGVDELLSEMAVRYLRHRPEKRQFRDRRDAASLVKSRVELAFRARVGDSWKDHIKKGHTLEGRLDEHRFDVVGENGHLLFAAHGLSFEGRVTRVQEREIAETAWAVDDMKARTGKLPVGVIALPPKSSSKTYDRARHVFEGLSASVVTEAEVDEWARGMAQLVPANS